MSVKITDLVDQQTIDKIIELNNEIQNALETYTEAAKDMAKGLNVNVKVAGDLDKLERLLIEKSREAVAANRQLTDTLGEQARVIGDTTPVISRMLMEKERVNKISREEYNDGTRVKGMLADVVDEYGNKARMLVKVELQVKANKEEQKKLESQYRKNMITEEAYIERQSQLIAVGRDLAVQKSNLTQVMKIEEKMNEENESSYNHLSQQLELLKKTYKQLDQTQREGDYGREMERAIQDLDAHLKDLAADMGEFQRNVGNYAIAGQNGVVSTESLKAVLSQEAVTMKDVADQTKILEKAKSMLDTEDEHYQHTLDIINEKLVENRARLTDVSDIMDVQANTAAEAEAQNKRFAEAIRNIDLTSDGARERIEELKSRMKENDELLRSAGVSAALTTQSVGEFSVTVENGVVTLDSLKAAMDRQAVTMKDVEDQTRLLEGARRMLDTSDENYAGTLAAVNAQIDENKRKLADVSDIMNVQATSVAEAEAQNKRLREALKLVDRTSEDTAATISALTARIEENDKMIEASSAKKSTIKTDLKELVLEIATLSIEYQNLSEEEQASAEGMALADHIQELTEKAAELKDAIGDTNAAISNAASDTRGLDQLGGAIQLAIDGFGLATGAAEMLGLSTEDLAEVQTKLQAAIAASNAMQSIQNTLQAQSSVMQGVALMQTRLRTTAENLHTAAKGKGVLATGALTAAQWAFNAAANANPIGLLVVAITAAIAAVWGLVKAFQAIFGPSKEALKNYEKQKEVLEQLCEVNDRLVARMKARGATEAELLTQSLRNKQMEKEATELLFDAAEKLYKKDSDEYKEALEAKKKADEDYEASVENSLNFLMKIKLQVDARERENAIGTLAYKIEIIEEEKRKQLELAEILYKNGELTRKVYEEIVASVNKAAEMKIKDLNDAEEKKNARKPTGPDPVKEAEKQAEELKKAVQAGEDAMLKIITDSVERQREAEILSYSRQLKELQEHLSKTKESQVLLRQSLYRQIEGLTAEHERKMVEIQYTQRERYIQTESDFIASHLAIVREGSADELEWKLKALDNQMQSELLAIAKAEEAKTVTVERAEELRANIVTKYSESQQKAIEAHAVSRSEKIMETYSVAEIERNEQHSLAITRLKERYNEELTIARGNASKQIELKSRLEEDLYQLELEYSRESLQSTVDMINEILKLEEMSVEDRLKWERELTQAKNRLDQLRTDAHRKEIDKQMEDDAKLKDKRLQNLNIWFNAAQETISNISDLVNALFDNNATRLEADLEANEEAGAKEQERITELVSKKVITEEEGEARKRAAEVQTQRKTEELEKKKAAVLRKQAIFQKAVTVANIGLETAAALMKLWVSPGWPVAIPMMAVVGAMGAIQLATALATPIPAYAKGTERHKGGPALVGDAGRHEVIVFRGEAFLTPDRPTIMEIPEGARVIPDVNIFGGNVEHAVAMSVSAPKQPSVVVNNDYSELKSEVRALGNLIRQQTKMQRRIASDQQYEIFKKGI